MGINISPNMNLPVPQVGNEDGPQYATDINGCMTLIDQHTHSPGYGVPIDPTGINVNSDLAINNNNLTLVKSVRFDPQSAPLAGAADLGCLYESGVDLFYNDGNGNQIQVTQNGGIAGSPGSISNLTPPASAAYVSADSTFVWQSAANTAANLDAGALLMRNLTANSKALTLQPPAAMAADYAITLPSLPGQTNIVTLGSTGTMAAVLNVDNSTLQIVSNQLSIKDQGVTKAKLAPVGQQISSSSGSFTTSSSSFVDVTNLSVTITTIGRPVMLALISDGTGTPAGISNPGSGGGGSDAQFMRDVTAVATYRAEQASGAANIVNALSFVHMDIPAAGTYTYKFQVRMDSAGTSPMTVIAYKLLAYEL